MIFYVHSAGAYNSPIPYLFGVAVSQSIANILPLFQAFTSKQVDVKVVRRIKKISGTMEKD